MKRLAVVLSVLSALFVASDASAQTARYTIAGDVRQPETYEFPAEAAVTVADLLKSGQRNSDAGIATVLRGTPPTPLSSEFVPAASDAAQQPATQSTGLLPGDIVIFRSQNQQPQTTGNAVVLFDETPRIIDFDPQALSVAALTTRLQAAINPASPVPVVRTSGNQAVRGQLRAEDLISHGDVILLTGMVKLPEQVVQQIFVPEPASVIEEAALRATSDTPFQAPVNNLPLVVVPRDSVLPSDSHPESGPDLITRSQMEASAITTLVPPEEPQMAQVAQSTPSPQTPAVPTGQPEITIPQPPTYGQNTAEAADTRQRPPMMTVSESRIVTADQQQMVRNSSAPADASRSADGSPLSGGTLPQPTDASETSTAAGAGAVIWNVLFFGGLIVAVTLVVVGWMKTNAEMNDQRRQIQALYTDSEIAAADQIPSDTDISDLVGQLSASQSRETGISEDAATSKEEQADELELAVDTAAAPTDSRPDPLQPTRIADDAPSVAEVAAAIQQSKAAMPQPAAPPAAPAPQKPMAPAQPVAAQMPQPAAAMKPMAEPAPSADVQQAQPAAEPAPKPVFKPVAQASGKINQGSAVQRSAEQFDHQAREQADQAVASAFSELEELIQNRLPVDLKQTDLPLRVTLFGRPAGPRRLRVDAAHETVPAPHMNMNMNRAGQRKSQLAAQDPQTD